MATKLGKSLASLTATGAAVLATPQAAAHDETRAAMRLEQSRYERLILDFEVEVRRRHDEMHAIHLEKMAAIFAEAVD